ncbi:MAG: hypothetical protein IPN94_23680 [Sphingobacteriales bacterium]|nr:hypothetical protein [Sphingobacteriales bacterium]
MVYFAMVASGGILFKSTDGGLTFTQTKAGGSPYLTFYTDDIADSGQGNYNFCIGVDNVDANKVWLQSHNTWYSNDSGSTWTMLTFEQVKCIPICTKLVNRLTTTPNCIAATTVACG